MQRGLRRGDAVAGTHSVYQQQRCDLGDAGFHRVQPDELAVELGQHLVEAGLSAGLRNVYGRIRRQTSSDQLNRFGLQLRP